MKIAIYWEQNEWGGVDSQLLTMLESWPSDDDNFLLYHNKGNAGLERIRIALGRLDNVKLKEIESWSYNEVYARMLNVSLPGILRKFVFFFQPFLFIHMLFKLTKLFKSDGEFDVLLSDNGGYPAAWGCLSAILAAKRARIPVRALLVHHEANKPVLFMGWFENIIDSLIMKAASVIVCPSYATCKTIINRRNINIDLVRMRVVYNEVTHKNNNNIEQASNIKKLIGADDELIIGIVGRIEPYKGHEDLIYAMSRLNTKELAKLKMVVIGKGDAAEIERLQRVSERLGVKEKIHFLGYLAGSSSAIIKQLDLLVVATRSFEGFGLTLAEAMLENTPVMATRVGAIPEFLDDSVGWLVSPGAPKEMFLALENFINNKAEWEKKTVMAKQRIHNVSGNMAEEYKKLFVECNDGPTS